MPIARGGPIPAIGPTVETSRWPIKIPLGSGRLTRSGGMASKNRHAKRARRRAEAIVERKTALPPDIRRTLGLGECQMANAGFFGTRTAAKETVSLNREYRGKGVRQNYQDVDPAYGWVVNTDPTKPGYIVQTWQPKQRRNADGKIEKVIDPVSGKPLLIDTKDGRHLSPEERRAKAKARRSAQTTAFKTLKQKCSEMNVVFDPFSDDPKVREGMRGAANALCQERHESRRKTLAIIASINSVTFNRNRIGEVPIYGTDHHNACTTVRHASKPEDRLPVTRTTAGPLSDYRIEASARVQRFNTQGLKLADDDGKPLPSPKIVKVTPPLPPEEYSGEHRAPPHFKDTRADHNVPWKND